MSSQNNREILGILGGIGPLASAAFLKTIYEYTLGEREQDSPIALLYSDPTFPDRTQVLLAGEEEELLEQLIQSLKRMSSFGVAKIVICCITSHHLFARYPLEIREKLISLIDVTLNRVIQSQKQHLLVCTKGTRRLEIFQKHPLWEKAKDYLVLPQGEDIQNIHDVIYQIKQNVDLEMLVPVFEDLLEKYQVESFVAGCTEIHLFSKYFSGHHTPYSSVDPLIIIAEKLAANQLFSLESVK
ncbi:MAG: amino acid racemase [Sodalinema sp.]|uniref:aspartate/glutamate racemase family protein n=1 Tax=Sodalinema sp. TaxID=3080550 RepID=UPI0011F7FCF9|nr:MAG: aspartate/glutamate racemase family protein [Phormidium sp. SL48-SHIP]